jgi:hypothetical protein
VQQVELEIDDQLDELQRSISRAKQMYSIWRVLWLEEATFATAFSRYKNVLWPVRDALSSSIVMALARFFDEHRRRTTIKRVFTRLCHQGKIADTNRREFEQKLEEAKRKLAGVEMLRHKVFAHHDRHLGSAEVFRKASTRANDLEKLIHLAEDMLNLVAPVSGFKGQFAFNLDSTATARAMLRNLSIRRPG